MADIGTTMQGFGTSGALGSIGTGMGIAGSVLEARTRRRAGEQVRIGTEFEARQMETEAGQSVAAAQRKAFEQRRRGQLLQSRALAIAAAGGGASDPGVIDIIADIEGEAAHRAATELYQGEDRARALRLGAAARRYEGDSAAAIGKSSAGPAFLKGAATLFSKYGAGGPPKSGNPNAGAMDQFQLYSGEGLTDPRYG